MNGKWMAVVVMCVAPVFLAPPAHSALQSGAVLTVDRGAGDCTWSELLSSYNCTNLAGSAASRRQHKAGACPGRYLVVRLRSDRVHGSGVA